MPVIINGTTGLSGVSTVNLANGSVTQNILANGVSTTGPAFSAYAATPQSISTNTATKVTFAGEEFDTANCFASSRFTPNVAGYYQINASIYLAGAANIAILMFYKNGSLYKQPFYITALTGPSMFNGAILVYLNGSTDFIEVYVQSANSNNVDGGAGAPYTHFSGFLARAA